tara:strand:+ start:75 stop:623 length:549 start_codon:yes stop_codon:yes gene_type:complete
MDPITIGAAIAATRQAVKVAKDLGAIGKDLDTLFNHQETHKKNKNKQQSARQSQNADTIRKRAGEEDSDDDTAISAVASDIIAERELEKSLESLKNEINRKWPAKGGGKPTWDLILEEREKRVKAKEEREKKAKIAAKEKAEHDKQLLHKILVEGGKVIIILLLVSAMGWFLMWAATAPKIR